MQDQPGLELDPMAVIQAQSRRIMTLTSENVQLEAAVAMLQAQIEALTPEVELDDDAEAYIKEVTDEVVGAEITS